MLSFIFLIVLVFLSGCTSVQGLYRLFILVEHELFALPSHLCSSPILSGVRVTRSLVLCVCFVDRCLYLCIFFCPLCCLFFFIYGFWLPLCYLQTLLRSDIVVRTIDIAGIVDHPCLNFLIIDTIPDTDNLWRQYGHCDNCMS